MTEERLQEVLARLDIKSAQIEIDGRPRHWIVQVTSPSFAAVPGHARQSRVWDHLLKEFSESEAVEVEYVFTVTPDEVRERDEERKAAG